MGTYDDDGIGFINDRGKLFHELYHRFVAFISKNWQRAATMRNIYGFPLSIAYFCLSHNSAPIYALLIS